MQRHVKRNKVSILPIDFFILLLLVCEQGLLNIFRLNGLGVVSCSAMHVRVRIKFVCCVLCANQVYTKHLGTLHWTAPDFLTKLN